MAPKLASDMAGKSLSVLLERVEQQQEFSPDEARELLASCEMSDLVLDTLWRIAQGFLNRGVEGRKLAFVLKEFVDVLELGLKGYELARARVDSAELPADEKAAGISLLARARRHAAERRDWLSALLRRLDAPPRQLDLSSLPAATAERQAQGYVSLETLTARLLPRDEA